MILVLSVTEDPGVHLWRNTTQTFDSLKTQWRYRI